jgi:hypothetical protein
MLGRFPPCSQSARTLSREPADGGRSGRPDRVTAHDLRLRPAAIAIVCASPGPTYRGAPHPASYRNYKPGARPASQPRRTVSPTRPTSVTNPASNSHEPTQQRMLRQIPPAMAALSFHSKCALPPPLTTSPVRNRCRWDEPGAESVSLGRTGVTLGSFPPRPGQRSTGCTRFAGHTRFTGHALVLTRGHVAGGRRRYRVRVSSAEPARPL